MGVTIYQVDAFTDRAFAGNPAAVCIQNRPADERWMQDVAREMNLSETAFLHPEADAFRLRWFTPATEVELCGHATLASAHVLWEMGLLALRQTARFQTLSGLLTAERQGQEIVMDFPATPAEPAEAPPGLAEALGQTPRYVGKNCYDYLLELESEAAVRQLQPDIGGLKAIPARGFIVTGQAEANGYDFVSRFFGPAVGVDEDPVTGSAHCCLGPFWSERLGKQELSAYQASPRGGSLRVRVAGDRVQLAGQAVTVLRGKLVAL